MAKDLRNPIRFLKYLLVTDVAVVTCNKIGTFFDPQTNLYIDGQILAAGPSDRVLTFSQLGKCHSCGTASGVRAVEDCRHAS